MAEKQRGKTASPSKAADKREDHEENLSLFLESSDDEAPEELTFEESKLEALRSVKDALDTARREKETLKEKRRRRQELFQEQKKRRLLPADVLEEIDSSSSKNQKPAEDLSPGGAQPQKKKKKKQKKKKKSGSLNHVRNLKGNYQVVTVKARASENSQQRSAEAFVQSRLYGPGSGRTTNNQLLSLQNKSGKNKSAAVQFVKKDWASKDRAKAEKLKKRWLHQQQIPSS